MVRLPSVRLTRSERRDAFSHRLLWLGFEVHYLAHLVVCRIGRIQPDHPPLSTFNIRKESPMSRATTVAEFVELNRGQDFQSGWRGALLDAIELGQIIAITDLRDDLTGFVALLVNEVQTNQVDWLMVVGFCHDCLTLCRWNAVTDRRARTASTNPAVPIHGVGILRLSPSQ